MSVHVIVSDLNGEPGYRIKAIFAITKKNVGQVGKVGKVPYFIGFFAVLKLANLVNSINTLCERSTHPAQDEGLL